MKPFYTCNACLAEYTEADLLVRGVLLPPSTTYKCPNCGTRLVFEATLRDKYEAKLTTLEEQGIATQVQMKEAEKESAEAETGSQKFRKWKAGLRELREAIAGNEPEIRLRLRNHLRELRAKVAVFAVGFEKEYNPDLPLPMG